MRRISLILAGLMLVFLPVIVDAAGTITATKLDYDVNSNQFAIEISWVADAADGSVPALTVNYSPLFISGLSQGWYIIMVKTDPGATAPTADYDITGVDSYGDIFKDRLLDRSATDTETVENILIPIYEDFDITIANNSVNSATGKILIIFANNRDAGR
jgi:hypothetical protein